MSIHLIAVLNTGPTPSDGYKRYHVSKRAVCELISAIKSDPDAAVNMLELALDLRKCKVKGKRQHKTT